MTEPFTIGPDYLNEALEAAEVKGITMTKNWRGQLKLDTEMSSTEAINVLVSGLARLYAKLMRARNELARQQEHAS
jgi:fructose-bisphosphate aldolase class 1